MCQPKSKIKQSLINSKRERNREFNIIQYMSGNRNEKEKKIIKVDLNLNLAGNYYENGDKLKNLL